MPDRGFVRLNTRTIDALIRREVEQGTVALAADLGAIAVDEIREAMLASHGGRSYRRRGVSHQASAPGEPPAVDTGKLIGALTWGVGRAKNGRVAVDIGTTIEAPYIMFLEYGTAHMAARPSIGPAMRRLKGRLRRIKRRAWVAAP